jgi:hypothetical protein
MRFVPIYLDALHAAERGEAARAAARRAMSARPDADPLPALEPVQRWSRLRGRVGSLLATVGLTARHGPPEAPDAA